MADSAAVVDGVNANWTVQLVPGSTPKGGAPQVPPATGVKSAALGPVTETAVTLSCAIPVSESVTITGALAEPCGWLPKGIGRGEG